MTIQYHKTQRLQLFVVLAIMLLATCSMLFLGHVKAIPPFQVAFVRLDRLKAATPTGGRVCVKPNTVAVEGKILVTFPTTSGTDYIVNGTAANWTTNTTGLDTGQTALPITGNVASSVSTKTVTFPVTSDLTVGTLYCFNFVATSTLTTSSAGATETTQGTIATQTAASAAIDFSTYSESIITDDQVVVNAVVPPSFSFTLSANTDNFVSNLNATSTPTLTTGYTITLLTNAASGWIVWAKDLNNSSSKGALNSVTAGNYKITNTAAVGSASHTFPAATENYGLAVVSFTDAGGGGTVTDTASGQFYDGSGSKAGTLDPLNFEPIASANGTANNDILNLKEQATIAGQTPAGSDYTDTITFVGAGLF